MMNSQFSLEDGETYALWHLQGFDFIMQGRKNTILSLSKLKELFSFVCLRPLWGWKAETIIWLGAVYMALKTPKQGSSQTEHCKCKRPLLSLGIGAA